MLEQVAVGGKQVERPAHSLSNEHAIKRIGVTDWPFNLD